MIHKGNEINEMLIEEDIRMVGDFYCIDFFFLTAPYGMWYFSFLTGIEPMPLEWEHRFLATGPPGKSVPC